MLENSRDEIVACAACGVEEEYATLRTHGRKYLCSECSDKAKELGYIRHLTNSPRRDGNICLGCGWTHWCRVDKNTRELRAVHPEYNFIVEQSCKVCTTLMIKKGLIADTSIRDNISKKRYEGFLKRFDMKEGETIRLLSSEEMVPRPELRLTFAKRKYTREDTLICHYHTSKTALYAEVILEKDSSKPKAVAFHGDHAQSHDDSLRDLLLLSGFIFGEKTTLYSSFCRSGCLQKEADFTTVNHAYRRVISPRIILGEELSKTVTHTADYALVAPWPTLPLVAPMKERKISLVNDTKNPLLPGTIFCTRNLSSMKHRFLDLVYLGVDTENRKVFIDSVSVRDFCTSEMMNVNSTIELTERVQAMETPTVIRVEECEHTNESSRFFQSNVSFLNALISNAAAKVIKR